MMRRAAVIVLLAGAALAAGAQAAEPPKFPDDLFMGEYAGTFAPAAGPAGKAEAKVYPVQDGYMVVLLVPPAEGKGGAKRLELKGKVEGDKLTVGGAAAGAEWSGTLAGKQLAVSAAGESGGKFDLKWQDRKSPTLGEKPPAGAIVLLPFEEGKPPSLEAWANDTWLALSDGSMMKGKGDNGTKQEFGSVRLHLEFMTPYEPAASGQDRGNSGVYLQDRYEIQVLDSFGLESKNNDCGGIYRVAAPKVNACLPPGRWQTYDITFTAPRFDASGKKTASARVTVLHNGAVIHQDQEIPGTTGGARSKTEVAVAPLRLQDHINLVRFRNIWVVELKAAEESAK